jgi:ferredoxin-NADP reductase/ferredoxin
VPKLRFGRESYDCGQDETVLDALLRQGVALAHSCRRGTCFSCMLKCGDGAVPDSAQSGMREGLKAQGYFLACQCQPKTDMTLLSPDDGGLYVKAPVHAVTPLTERICRIELQAPDGFAYQAGQFVNLRRPDGLVRSYSLASHPSSGPMLELHVAREPGGRMSNWLHDCVRPGDTLELAGPNGDCCYRPGNAEQPLLLVGTGTGLAPLLGILRDALANGHRGPIGLYHGSHSVEGLYLQDELKAMAAQHAPLDYVPCVSGGPVGGDLRHERADAAAFADHPDLAGYRVYLCGHPAMVHAARQSAFVMGAGFGDISGDAFEKSAPPESGAEARASA